MAGLVSKGLDTSGSGPLSYNRRLSVFRKDIPGRKHAMALHPLIARYNTAVIHSF
jgi:hypothetical protein